MVCHALSSPSLLGWGLQASFLLPSLPPSLQGSCGRPSLLPLPSPLPFPPLLAGAELTAGGSRGHGASRASSQPLGKTGRGGLLAAAEALAGAEPLGVICVQGNWCPSLLLASSLSLETRGTALGVIWRPPSPSLPTSSQASSLGLSPLKYLSSGFLSHCLLISQGL